MAKATLAIAFLIASPTLAATPSMTGLYRAGELGIVDLQTTEGRLVARFRGAGSCAFKNDLQVLSGTFEGDVFLGTVFICQEGPSCEREKTFPFFAVYHDGALAGDVRLDTGCASPGLEGKRLNISVASGEDRLLISHDDNASASTIAGRNANKKELEQLAVAAYRDAQTKLANNNFAAARIALEKSITYDDSAWKTWFYLSQVELKLDNPAKALQSVEKAVLAANKAKPKLSDQEMSELFYNQACAQARNGKKREAIQSVRNAIKVGDAAELSKAASDDSDLSAVKDEPEFKRLLADARNKKDKRPR